MATSIKHNGFKRLLDRAASTTLSNSFSTTDSTLAILVEGQEALAFKKDNVGTYGMLKLGNQPAESLTYMADGYGVSLATGYSASATNRIYALEINADTGSTDLTGDTNVGAIKGRIVIGTTQTNMGASAIVGTMDVGTVNIISNYNGLCGVLDFYGNCTIGGSVSHCAALTGVVWNEATTTLNSAGGCVAGLDLIQNSGIPTLTAGINPAILIRAGTSSRWQYGVYMEPTHIHHAFRAGNQPGEALANIIDGYGISMALDYSATRYSFGTSYRLYGLEINGDTGSVDCTGDVNLGAIKGRMVAGTTQSNCGISGIVGTLDVGTVNLQGNFNGVCGVMDLYGNCTLGTGATCYGAGLVSVVWNEAQTTLGAGAVLSGVDIVENGAIYSAGSGALNPGITIRGSWTSALNITAAGCYTTAYTGNSAFVPNSKGTFTQTGQLKIIVAGNTVYVPFGTVA